MVKTRTDKKTLAFASCSIESIVPSSSSICSVAITMPDFQNDCLCSHISDMPTKMERQLPFFLEVSMKGQLIISQAISNPGIMKKSRPETTTKDQSSEPNKIDTITDGCTIHNIDFFKSVFCRYESMNIRLLKKSRTRKKNWSLLLVTIVTIASGRTWVLRGSKAL